MNPKLFTSAVLSKTLGLFVMTAMLASCGTKTNPTDGYDLGGVPTATQNQVLSVAPGTLLVIEKPALIEFIEGKQSSYTIVAHTVANATFALQADGLPAGVSMVQAPIDPLNPKTLSYVISGTVLVGSSPAMGSKSVITLQVVDIQGKDAERLQKATNPSPYSMQLNVSPTDQVPLVEPSAPLSVTEGDSLKFSIIVKDRGAHNSEMPHLQPLFVDELQTPELTRIDAFTAVKMNRTASDLGDQRFEFKGAVDTSLLKLPAGTKNVTARVSFKFESPSGRTSAEEYVDITIVRKVVVPPVAAPATNAAPASTNNAAVVTNSASPAFVPPSGVTPAVTAPINAIGPAAPVATTNAAPPPEAAPAVIKPKSSAKSKVKKSAKKHLKKAAAKPSVAKETK